MADRPVDPSRLEGEALRRWYLRSPDDIERERQVAADRRYQAFFGRGRIDPGFSREAERPVKDVDPGLARGPEKPVRDVDPAFSWTPLGPNRWRGDPPGPAARQPAGGAYANAAYRAAYLDRGLAGSDDGAELIDIGGKARSQRRQWEKREGQEWPKTESGRNYDRSHIVPKADGGPDTVDNIRPQHPDEHRADHVRNGDFGRWGRRSSVARGFGGTVGRALGPLGIFSDVLGILSGRYRTDTPRHFYNDYMGVPDPDDRPIDPSCAGFPGAKPGMQCA